MTQPVITLTRPAIKAQLKRFLMNATFDNDEGVFHDELTVYFDPRGISLNDVADAGVVLRQKEIFLGNGSRGFQCQMNCHHLDEEKIGVLADAWLDFGFEFEELLTLQVNGDIHHLNIHPYKEKPARHLTFQNGVCQSDDYGLLDGVFLDIEDGDYYINETLLLNKIEEDEE